MSPDLQLLLVTAASIGFVHTLAGPDHYLPFVIMGRARQWPVPRTLAITFACGLGHVLSSVILGVAGIWLGLAVSRLEGIEAVRGGLATWLLIGFGLAYGLWGLRLAWRGHVHSHRHLHGRADEHEHAHDHRNPAHSHVHDQPGHMSLTPWVLFTVFVLGPCEPLIPILMYPALRHGAAGFIGVTIVFGVVTIGTMLVVVRLALSGLTLVPVEALGRYSHALAGLAIAATGLAILLLGL